MQERKPPINFPINGFLDIAEEKYKGKVKLVTKGRTLQTLSFTKKIAALRAAFFQLLRRAAAFVCKQWGPSGPTVQEFFSERIFFGKFFLGTFFSGNFFRENFVRENFFRGNFFRGNFFQENFFQENFLGKLFFRKLFFGELFLGQIFFGQIF